MQNRTVKRANGGNIKLSRLFEQTLHLSAVFSHDADIITARLVLPILFYVKSTEFAKSVRGEQNLVLAIVADHYLRPMHHWRVQKCERVSAKREGAAVFGKHTLRRKALAEKLLYHFEGLFRCHNGSIGVEFQKAADVGRVVGLHMLYYQIVGRSAIQGGLQVVKPFVREGDIHRV